VNEHLNHFSVASFEKIIVEFNE
jgi:hypothetical protein